MTNTITDIAFTAFRSVSEMQTANAKIMEAGEEGVEFQLIGKCPSASFDDSGMECFCIVNERGIPCGYVRVDDIIEPRGETDFGDLVEVPVHGGVTFTGTLPPQYGKGGTWIGFDMGHDTDFGYADDVFPTGEILGIPMMQHVRCQTVVKTLADCIRETRRFAEATRRFTL